MILKKDRKKEKIKLDGRQVVQLVIIALMLLCIGGLFYYYNNFYKGNERAVEAQKADNTTFEKSVNISRNSFEYNGKKYKYNDHLSNFLFLGIDKRKLEDTTKGSAAAGQSDAIYVLSMDRMSGETRMISVPRDTMTNITVITSDTQENVQMFDHLSIQYGYGDGKHESCNLTKNAVTGLMYGLPIQGYCAIALDSLKVLAKSVDGVKVEVPNDSLVFKDDAFKPGETVTINDRNIELFLRTRDIEQSQTAIYRLDRQRVFLKAFLERAKEKYEEDPALVTELFEDLQPYMVTNMGTDQFVKLMDGASYGSGIGEWTVPGEGVSTTTYDEYHVDEDALLQMLLDTVCIELEK